MSISRLGGHMQAIRRTKSVPGAHLIGGESRSASQSLSARTKFGDQQYVENFWHRRKWGYPSDRSAIPPAIRCPMRIRRDARTGWVLSRYIWRSLQNGVVLVAPMCDNSSSRRDSTECPLSTYACHSRNRQLPALLFPPFQPDETALLGAHCSPASS